IGCGTGMLAVGIFGRSGNKLVDGVGLRCAQLLPDGSLSAITMDTPQVGSANDSPFSDRCPDGQIIVGLYGWTNQSVIVGLGVICAPVRGWISSGMLGPDLPLHGNDKNQEFRDVCPAGYVLASLWGRTMNEVVTLQGHCIRVLN